MLQQVREAKPLQSLANAHEIRIGHLLLQVILVDTLCKAERVGEKEREGVLIHNQSILMTSTDRS